MTASKNHPNRVSVVRRTGVSPLAAFWVGSFLLHLGWEVAQMPLFERAHDSFWEGFKMCLFATATGDMLFMLTLYLTVAVVHRDLRWVADRTAYNHPATWVVPAVVGTLIAVSFELWAVHAVSRWEYGSMPIIPVLGVGLTPVLQMIAVPLFVLTICRWAAGRRAGQVDGVRAA